MKSTRFYAYRAIILVTVLAGSVAVASGGQPLELNIQMVPGIWITGATGAVSIEYTTNLDQTSGWALLSSVQATNSLYFYIDATATNAQKRFYRAVTENASLTNPDPQHLVWINSGTFIMGSPLTEKDRNPNEGPQTQVTLSHGFWMSKYETTLEEYVNVMGSNSVGVIQDPKLPMTGISWTTATNYCTKLTAIERVAGRLPAGYEYRLPTEAEWEYACRAGTTTRFSYGDDLDYTQLGDYAWYGGNKNHPVGMKLPNAWGLYDMHGNVSEYCLDWFGTYEGGSVTDPRGPSVGSKPVYRGGSAGVISYWCRSASRYSANSPNTAITGLGIRPVLALGQ